MFINDLFLILFWLILLLTIAFSAFPLVWRLLRRLPDGGFAISPVIGIILPGWLAWVMSSLHILPLNISAPVSFAILIVSGIFTLARHRLKIKQFIRKKRLILFIELTILSISLFFWSFIRGFQPDIQGLEKFMDMGFVNSILKSRFMPPADMWLSGETVNYYYFGHYLTAFITLLSGIDSAYTYNLMLATVFALSMLGSFGFVINFCARLGNFRRKLSFRSPARRAEAAGTHHEMGDSELENFSTSVKIKIFATSFLTAILLNFGGNLHTAWHFLTQQSKPYWYPNATRFIPYTIHEFPAYSHVVADLHGHLLDLPIVLTFLTALLSYLAFFGRTLIFAKQKSAGTSEPRSRALATHGRRPWEQVSVLPGLLTLIFLGFLLGIMTMTNFWDLPIYGLIFGLVVVAKGLSSRSKVSPFKVFWFIFTSCLLTLASCILVSLPFHLNFNNFSQGVAITQTHSPLWQLGILWGGFALIGVVAIWIFIRSLISRTTPIPLIILLPPILVFVSFLLILIPEIIYVKDIYIQNYHRANTMFKLTYQSFVMMCLVWGITFGYLISNFKFPARKCYALCVAGGQISNLAEKIILLIIFSAHMLYPFFSIKSYYGLKNYRGLYGLQFLQTSYPDDYAAILWLKKNITGAPASPTGGPVIVEAVGDSYTDHARISSFTGLPTILGWRVHEWLWRGSFDEAGKRTEIVRKMYETPTAAETKTLFNQYQIKYIFIGSLERQAYKVDESSLQSIFAPVFRSGSTVIYKLN